MTHEKSPSTAGPSRLLQKRHSQGRLLGKAAVDPGLREALALGNAKLKKPAAANQAPLKKPAAAKVTVKEGGTKASDHRPWLKISKTVAKKPGRAYLPKSLKGLICLALRKWEKRASSLLRSAR